MNTVPPKINDQIKKEMHQFYPKIVEALTWAICLLGKQGLALSGHRESLENETNKTQGNFFTAIREIGHSYPLLKNNLEDPLHKDELIEIIGKRLIQRKLIDEINEAGIHSISAGKVTASNDEILSICVRYVNNRNEFARFLWSSSRLKESLETALEKQF